MTDAQRQPQSDVDTSIGSTPSEPTGDNTVTASPPVTPPTQRQNRFARPGLFLLCAATLVSAVGLTLPSYGYTFDEVLGALYKGESILEYWLHGADRTYLQTGEKHIAYYDDVTHPDFHRGSRATRLWQFYAFPKTVSALCCHFLRSWILPIDAHHLAIVLIALIGLWYIYRTGWEEAGPVAAVAAFWIVALHPRVFAHMHNNLKDVCVATLMAATILMFRRATMTQSVGALLWAAVLLAMSVASKLNAVFVPVIGLPWFICWLALHRKSIRRRWLIAFLFTPIVSLAVWCVLDPMFSNDPAQLGEYYRFYSEVAGGGAAHWNWFGLRKFLTCTPPVFLGFFVVGLIWLAWKRRGYDLLFYGWWFTLPILRVCVPNAKDCDGIRHYLECIPPFAIVAAFGLMAMCRPIAARFATIRAKRSVFATGLAVCLAPALVVIWRYHPHQTVYYNCFVGGYHGARGQGLRDGDYWCSSYREVIDWMLANNLEPGVIDATYGSHILQYYTVVVGGRFTLVHTPEGDQALSKGGRLYLIEHEDATRKRHAGLVREIKAPPIYQIRRDGRVIVSLHAIDLPELDDDFDIDPRGADDQRLKVGHQIGRRGKDGWYVSSKDKRAFMIYGPYIQDPPPGAYSVTFELKLVSSSGADVPVCTLDVFDATSRRKLAERQVVSGDFGEPRESQSFELAFTAPPGASLEFRVFHEGNADYGCGRIHARRVDSAND
ncbi:MAG TPA: glycosyltransferase family 39 protein [Phycisphaerae bacterium]|nr:glycosyltransferase family 39 protein [Phycisphaerae bacterium]HRW51407.1 glycosyltransferase family 39 protein [Phycisphaerae bacterium]